MRLFEIIALRVRSLFRRKRVDDELASEIRFHLEEQIRENLAAGMSPEEARYAAMRTTGGVAKIQEECREMRRTGWIENSWQDLRYALRVLSKSPGFTAVAVLSLALGIGANAAVFSVVHAVLVRSLPYPQPDNLMLIVHRDGIEAVNMPEFTFVRDHATSFTAVGAHAQLSDQTLTVNGNAEGVKLLTVSSGFFEMLGVQPEMGREFNSTETKPGGPRSIVITSSLWRRGFQSDLSILGRSITIGGASFAVIGVLPERFWFPEPADGFIPLRSTDQGYNSTALARLKPGINSRQADAELATLLESYRHQFPDLAPADYKGLATLQYQRWLVGEVRASLLLLFGAVALLLLIACSNLAGLLFARLNARQREIAVRLALGGTAGRLMRLFLIENLVIIAAGCGLGLVVANWSIDELVHLFPYQLPSSKPIGLDGTVLAFAIMLTFLIGLALSMVPLIASAFKLGEALKSSRATIGGVRQRARSILVVAEVAVSTALLAAAALLISSLYRIHQEPLGFQSKDLLTFSTPPSRARTKPAEILQFESTMLERIATVPGVKSVGAINLLPLTDKNNYPTQREGHPDQSIGGMEIRRVTPSYFETMGIHIVRGRPFNISDSDARTPVVIVNETVAREWWPDGNPIGDRLEIGKFHGKAQVGSDQPRMVVAVVADTKSIELKKKPRPTVYVPTRQSAKMDVSMSWVVRAPHAPGLTQQLRSVIAGIDPAQRVLRLQTMDEIVASTTKDSRFDAWLFGAFAALALLLTAVGVYGLLAFSVAQRTSEIGIRLALGATRGGVFALVLRQGVLLIASGLAIGLAGAFGLTRFFSKLLFGVSPTDPTSFAAVCVVLAAVGLLASYLPARRAVRIDPMVALRYE